MTGPMALLWAGVSSEGGLEISARAQTGRGGQPYPPRDGFLWGGTVGPGGLAVPRKKGGPGVLGLGSRANLRTTGPLPPRPARGALLLRL